MTMNPTEPKSFLEQALYEQLQHSLDGLQKRLGALDALLTERLDKQEESLLLLKQGFSGLNSERDALVSLVESMKQPASTRPKFVRLGSLNLREDDVLGWICEKGELVIITPSGRLTLDPSLRPVVERNFPAKTAA
jgi:hypothetical protein